jgi:beta-barrel assembly-enhancing protease
MIKHLCQLRLTGLIVLVSIVGITFSCGNSKSGKKGFNLFTLEQDRQFGSQVDAEISADKTQFPLLDSIRYRDVYKYVYGIRNTILNSGNVRNKDEFKWEIKIIHDDKTLNAFCTPGGYIYIYTGILKFLDSEDQFAGVLAHEIAHADLRHSTRQMTQMFGIEVLLAVLAGDKQMIKQVTGGLIGLKFSRNHETEADYNSVRYLCPTAYNAAGGAGFFQKITELNTGSTPEFLSTHPNPTNRIEAFNNNKITQGCTGEETNVSAYKEMLRKLP